MLIIDFNAVQSCDCSIFSIVDASNVGVDNPVASFTSRTLTLTYANGTQTITNFPFTGGAFSPVLVISEIKDFAAVATLTYLSTTNVTISRDKNIVSTCRADKAAQDKAGLLLKVCDRKKVLGELMDLNAGIISAIRLTQLGDIEDAQCTLDYLHNLYGGGCGCGCS